MCIFQMELSLCNTSKKNIRSWFRTNQLTLGGLWHYCLSVSKRINWYYTYQIKIQCQCFYRIYKFIYKVLHFFPHIQFSVNKDWYEWVSEWPKPNFNSFWRNDCVCIWIISIVKSKQIKAITNQKKICERQESWLLFALKL